MFDQQTQSIKCDHCHRVLIYPACGPEDAVNAPVFMPNSGAWCNELCMSSELAAREQAWCDLMELEADKRRGVEIDEDDDIQWDTPA